MLIVSVWLILRSNPFYEPKADSPARSTTESTAALKSTKRCAPLPPSAPSVTPAGPAVPSDPKPAVPDKVSITCPALGPRALVSSSPKVKSLPHSRVTLVFFFSFPVQNGPLCLIHSAIFFLNSYSVVVISFSPFAATFLLLLLFFLFFFHSTAHISLRPFFSPSLHSAVPRLSFAYAI